MQDHSATVRQPCSQPSNSGDSTSPPTSASQAAIVGAKAADTLAEAPTLSRETAQPKSPVAKVPSQLPSIDPRDAARQKQKPSV